VPHCVHDDMFSHFDRTVTCDRQTDGQTTETQGHSMFCTSSHMIMIGMGNGHDGRRIGINAKESLLGEGGCIAVVCEVVCYTEVRPGLSGKKMRWHFSEQSGQMDV